MNYTKISVIILNWLRPNNIRNYILPVLVQCPFVDEIIISHGRKDTYFDYSIENKHIIHRQDHELNHLFGLSLRFLAARDARNNLILFIDDDLVPSHVTLLRMMKQSTNNYPCLISKYGRNITTKLPYDNQNIQNNRLPICLTSLFMIPKLLIDIFWEKNFHILPFVMKHSKPLWNGEDIFISLLGVFHFNKLGYICHDDHLFPVVNLTTPEDIRVAISSGEEHYEYRNELVKEIIRIKHLLIPQSSAYPADIV